MRDTPGPLAPKEIAETFKEGESVIAEVSDVLRSLNRLGQVESYDNGRSYFTAA